MKGLTRRSIRVQREAEVKLRRSADRAYQVQLRDISQHGCSIDLINKVQVGERLWVKLPGLEAIEGFVCWKKEFTEGIDFAAPLHPAVFDMLAAKHKT